MTSEQHAPVEALASAGDTGKSCPYCRFPLKEGAGTTSCGHCAATHHSDCWTDNVGCAVVACQGGPTEAPPKSAPPSTPVAATGTTPPILPPIDPSKQHGAGQGLSFDEVAGEMRKLGNQLIDGLSLGTRIAAGGGLALFFSLFFKWFSFEDSSGFAFGGENGWAMPLGTLLLLVVAAMAVAPAVIHRVGAKVDLAFDLATAIAAGGALASAYVAVWGLLVKPGTADGVTTSVSIGVVVALTASAAVCFGGYKLMSEHDRRVSSESG